MTDRRKNRPDFCNIWSDRCLRGPLKKALCRHTIPSDLTSATDLKAATPYLTSHCQSRAQALLQIFCSCKVCKCKCRGRGRAGGHRLQTSAPHRPHPLPQQGFMGRSPPRCDAGISLNQCESRISPVLAHHGRGTVWAYLLQEPTRQVPSATTCLSLHQLLPLPGPVAHTNLAGRFFHADGNEGKRAQGRAPATSPARQPASPLPASRLETNPQRSDHLSLPSFIRPFLFPLLPRNHGWLHNLPFSTDPDAPILV